jgi:AcrR family transcriptional regulator
VTQRREARDRILDAALEIAETRGWEAVRLADAAHSAGVALADLPSWFREKEDLVDAWFERADRALLADAARSEFKDLPPRARLHRAIMTWLRTLATHRRATRQMVLTRLKPGHIHIQCRALHGVNRTVQWLREATRRDARCFWRALEETALMAIFLTTFLFWLWDDSADAARTSRLLDRLLGGAERVACCTPLARRTRSERARTGTPPPNPTQGSGAAPAPPPEAGAEHR